MEGNAIRRQTVAKTQEENTPLWRVYTSNSIYGLNPEGWKGLETFQSKRSILLCQRCQAWRAEAWLAERERGTDVGQYRAAPWSEKENFQGLKVVRGDQATATSAERARKGSGGGGECRARLARWGGGVDDGRYRAVPWSEKENFQGLKVVRRGWSAPLD